MITLKMNTSYLMLCSRMLEMVMEEGNGW